MTHETLQTARSFLFVPGDRPDRFAKALASGADAVVLDLEDAVAPEAKDAARAAVVTHLREDAATGPTVVVRINDPRTADGEADVVALAPLAPAVMVPKAESVGVLAGVAVRLGPEAAILPLVETARGVLDVRDVAQAPGVQRLVLGHLDLAAELGIDPDADEMLAPARFALLAASAEARLPGPVDGVSTAVSDLGRVARDTEAALSRGFTGRLCIHPAQVPIVHAGLAPDPEELSWAQRVLLAVARTDTTSGPDASGAGTSGPASAVTVVDGRMVDRPVELRAAAIVARSHHPDLPSTTPDSPTTEEPSA